MDNFQREPCPDRILVDTGGAIAMGFVGSVLYQVFLQPKDKPGFRLKYLKQRVFRTTANFGTFGFLFASTDCVIYSIRNKESPLNAIIAGAVSGGLMAINSGRAAIIGSAVIGGFFIAIIEGAGIAFAAMQADQFKPRDPVEQLKLQQEYLKMQAADEERKRKRRMAGDFVPESFLEMLMPNENPAAARQSVEDKRVSWVGCLLGQDPEMGRLAVFKMMNPMWGVRRFSSWLDRLPYASGRPLARDQNVSWEEFEAVCNERAAILKQLVSVNDQWSAKRVWDTAADRVGVRLGQPRKGSILARAARDADATSSGLVSYSSPSEVSPYTNPSLFRIVGRFGRSLYEAAWNTPLIPPLYLYKVYLARKEAQKFYEELEKQHQLESKS